MENQRIGWCVVYAALCVCAHPAVKQTNSIYIQTPKIDDLEAMGSSYVFDDLPTDQFSKLIDTGLEDFEGKLIPIKSPKRMKNDFELLSMQLEPDAEMLPAHYTGVKPPGVDHMELRHAEPDISETNLEGMVYKSINTPQQSKNIEQAAGARRESSKEVAGGEKVEHGRKKVVAFETAAKGESGKEKQKKEYSEADGKKKTHSNQEKKVKEHTDKLSQEKGSSYEVEGKREKGHNVAGYHNVYHKDEYKKDADFYDNDHRGGKFKKHGRYNEKHTATEGAFEKAGSSDSGFEETEHAKEGQSQKSQVNQEAKGHEAQQGYDGFFGNFEGFGKKGGSAEGRKFGFINSKAR